MSVWELCLEVDNYTELTDKLLQVDTELMRQTLLNGTKAM